MIHSSALARRTFMDVAYDVLDGGSLELRSGAPESNPEADPTGVLLATLQLGSPAFAPSAGNAGVTVSKAFYPPGPVQAVATGTAGHFRLVTSAGTCVAVGLATEAGQGGDLTMPCSITAGQTVSLGGGAMRMAY